MQQIVTNNYVDMALTGLFMALIVVMVLFCLRALVKAWKTSHPTAHEEPYVALDSVASTMGVSH
jgi:carbon starvation protein